MGDASAGGKIGFLGATAIGIGGMVGGGIFAVLGLAVILAGGGTPVAFGLAGVVAIFTAYSYAKLSVRYPSEGGTVTFLNKAFGTGRITGSALESQFNTTALPSYPNLVWKSTRKIAARPRESAWTTETATLG